MLIYPRPPGLWVSVFEKVSVRAVQYSVGRSRCRRVFRAELRRQEKADPEWPVLCAAGTATLWAAQATQLATFYSKEVRPRPPADWSGADPADVRDAAVFELPDEGITDALYSSHAIRRLVGIDLAHEGAPDVTTLLCFRRLLEPDGPTQADPGYFQTIKDHLGRLGLFRAPQNPLPGLAKNMAQLFALRGLANLLIGSLRLRPQNARSGCWDNACSETLFGSLKGERLHGQRFKIRRQAMDEVIAWILWHNRTRLHSTLAYLSPMQFEENWQAHQPRQASS